MAGRRRKGNAQLEELMLELRRASRQSKAPLWSAVADRLDRARHSIVPLNVGQLERLAKAGETVAVPGKLLASGLLSKKLTVGAFSFSEEARAKIHAAGGTAVPLAQLLKSHPDGTGVRLLA
jgi:large subunit ribosomal protein L18e